jgi:hypothetical protein
MALKRFKLDDHSEDTEQCCRNSNRIDDYFIYYFLSLAKVKIEVSQCMHFSLTRYLSFDY